MKSEVSIHILMNEATCKPDRKESQTQTPTKKCKTYIG